jgi:hypothetical protein
MKEKICRIIYNFGSSYTLKVDDQDILFHSEWNAKYFEEHYKKLGYQIIKEKE